MNKPDILGKIKELISRYNEGKRWNGKVLIHINNNTYNRLRLFAESQGISVEEVVEALLADVGKP